MTQYLSDCPPRQYSSDDDEIRRGFCRRRARRSSVVHAARAPAATTPATPPAAAVRAPSPAHSCALRVHHCPGLIRRRQRAYRGHPATRPETNPTGSPACPRCVMKAPPPAADTAQSANADSASCGPGLTTPPMPRPQRTVVSPAAACIRWRAATEPGQTPKRPAATAPVRQRQEQQNFQSA